MKAKTNTIEITFKGRTFEVNQIADNVCEHSTRGGKTNYYLRERTSGQWKYSHGTRFESLVKRFGSVEAVSDRYLTPVDVAIISTEENHQYRYLLDKQPKATRTRKPKAEKADDPRVETEATSAPLTETETVASE